MLETPILMPDSRRTARLGSDIKTFPTGGFFHEEASIGLDFCSLYVLIRNDRPTCELAHADPETDGKTALKPPVGEALPLRLQMCPSRRNIGNRYSKTLVPARPGPSCGSDVFPRFSATCCASSAAAASGPWKSRPPMQSDCMAATRSGRTSRSDCSTTPASSAPEDTKKTGAGRDLT